MQAKLPRGNTYPERIFSKLRFPHILCSQPRGVRRWLGVLWSYGGRQHASFLAGEAINARRTIPRARIIGALVVTASSGAQMPSLEYG